MYASPKERSYDLTYYYGGHTASPADTVERLDLPKSVYLAKPNPIEKKFSIRLDLHSKYIEIPLSMTQLKEWFAKIEEEDAVALERELAEEREERESERSMCTLKPSTYDHDGECVPLKKNASFVTSTGVENAEMDCLII